ncbi:MAG: membrane protein insertion efficiency factor YidD [Elusimicrobiota bacterium]
MKKLSVLFIKVYQIIARPFPRQCRFYPSCSVYAVESLEKFGFFKGWFLVIKRLFKCGPWNAGGFDPVP